MRSYIWTFLVLLCFGVIDAYGQDPKIDSLKALIQEAREDTTKVNLLNELSYSVLNLQPKMPSSMEKWPEHWQTSLTMEKEKHVL